MKISLSELKRRVGQSYAALSCCKLCPRECGVNRLLGRTGVCHIGKVAKVSSHNVHAGEEPPITGTRGSGTIFFSSCNLHCKFCQNYPISQLRHGRDATPQELAQMMLWLERQSCHNINLVTPSHVVPQILAGLYIAKAVPSPPAGEGQGEGGLSLPIVYNSSGYEGLAALKFLDGVVDIYMPDIKYSSNDIAEHYSAATNYWDAVRPAIKEMFRQVGLLETGPDGIGRRGLIIRHMVLPGGLSGTEKVLEFIAEEISRDVHVSLMSQYFPAHKVVGDPIIGRRLTREEWKAAENLLHKFGLQNGWVQPY